MIKPRYAQQLVKEYEHAECRKCGHRIPFLQYAYLRTDPRCDCGEPFGNFCWVTKPAHNWEVTRGWLQYVGPKT